MSKFVTSDTHIGHINILKYCPRTRPFASVADMNDFILKTWNQQVSPDDEVYHLGDIFMSDRVAGIHFLENANGKKYLIRGNHDRYKNFPYENYFEWIRDYYELGYRKNKIVMCHYPIEYWNMGQYGMIHLHGHLHGDKPEGMHDKANRFDVGWDAHNRLIPLDEILEWKVDIKHNHHDGSVR